MTFITELWLPILLSAVFVFVISSVVHMVLGYHKSDCKKMPGEAQVLAAMRAQNTPAGDYVFPCPTSMKDMASPEMIAKYREGPVGFLTLRPSGMPSMNKALVQWFLFSILVGIFVAYVTMLGAGHAASRMHVFRIAGAVATLGYGVSHVPDSIWKGHSWSITAKFIFDGVLYGLATGATFAWLWPTTA